MEVVHYRSKPAVNFELLIDGDKVGLNSVTGHEEARCDLLVRATLRKETQNFVLTLSKLRHLLFVS
jgi:hypothetical protein